MSTRDDPSRPTHRSAQVVLAFLVTLGGCAELTPSSGHVSSPAHLVEKADITLRPDPDSLAPDGTYARDGYLAVSGLFWRDGAPLEQKVSVHVESRGAKLDRRYEFELSNAILGASTSVPLEGGGVLSISFPRSLDGKGDFKINPKTVTAMATRSPNGKGLSVCLRGRDVFAGNLRFIACGLGLPGREFSMGFVDADPHPSGDAGADSTPAR